MTSGSVPAGGAGRGEGNLDAVGLDTPAEAVGFETPGPRTPGPTPHELKGTRTLSDLEDKRFGSRVLKQPHCSPVSVTLEGVVRGDVPCASTGSTANKIKPLTAKLAIRVIFHPSYATLYPSAGCASQARASVSKVVLATRRKAMNAGRLGQRIGRWC